MSWNIAIKDIKLEYTILKCGNIYNYRPVTEGIKSIFTSFFGSNEKSVTLDDSNRFFVRYLQTYKVFSVYNLPISIMSYIIIIILLNIWMYKKVISKEEKNKFLSYIIAIKIGLIVYMAFLQLAYLTRFATIEMLKHASLERYVNSYFLGELVFTITILLEYFDKDINKQKLKYVILTLIIVLVTPLYSIANATIFFGSYNIDQLIKIDEIKQSAIELKNKVNKKSKIYVVHQNSDVDCDLYKFKYFLVPEIDIDITQKINKELKEQYEDENRNLKEEWINILKTNYEYLYIIDADKYFKQFAEDIFKSEIKDSTLYRINELEDGNIMLIEE